MGRNLNLSRAEAASLKMEFAKVAVASGDVAINSTRLAEANADLNSQLGTAVVFSGEMLKTTSKLTKLVGLSAEAAGSLAFQAQRSGQSVREVEENICEDKMEVIKEVFKKIFPTEEVLFLVFYILASGLIGKPIEKFFVFNGDGRNGKGVINEMMKWCLGDYFAYVSPSILTENQKNRSSSAANPEMTKLHKKRYVVLKEPSKDQPLHNNVIKDMTGGGEIQARTLYKADTAVKLNLTLVMECNKKPPFAETPDGQADGERIVDILFGSFFTNEYKK